jgi:transcription elongation factor SPT4
LDGYVPGVYAIKVSGQLPDEIRSSLEDEYRIHYIPYVYFHRGIRRHDTT